MSTFPSICRKSIIGSLQSSNNNRLILFYGIIYSFSQISALKMLSVDYEVHGRVQGVFFRKHTQKRARELGLTGWVKNTSTGTVVGQMEGNDANVLQMKQWLQKVGSPQSRIDKCEFKNEKPISKTNFKDFSVKG